MLSIHESKVEGIEIGIHINLTTEFELMYVEEKKIFKLYSYSENLILNMTRLVFDDLPKLRSKFVLVIVFR